MLPTIQLTTVTTAIFCCVVLVLVPSDGYTIVLYNSVPKFKDSVHIIS